MDIRTVLCPVDLTALSENEVDLAGQVCQRFDARLVLLHALAPSAEAEGSRESDRPSAEDRLHTLTDRLPETLSTDCRLLPGPAGPVITQLARELPADLMLLARHHRRTSDRGSLTEALLNDCPCPILIIHEGRGDRHPFQGDAHSGKRPPRVLIPTDFSNAARRAVDFGFDLARKLPVEIHLLHVAQSTNAAEIARRKLEQRVPDSLSHQLRCHVTTGEPPHQILAYSRILKVAMVVMGEHARGILRRYLTRDTARELLHHAPCAVWFMPGRAS